MNYVKPEVHAVGDAVDMIELTGQKINISLDSKNRCPSPAYDLDD